MHRFSGVARVVDDVLISPFCAEADRDHVVELDIGLVGSFNGLGQDDIGTSGRRCKRQVPKLRGW